MTPLRDELTRELTDVLFASFARRDQRLKGEQYLRGLLSTPHRKSIRHIAAQVGGSATEQSLHHFISNSTWDWKPVRQALASYLSQLDTPMVWVVHPMPIPKAGDQSVGVEEGFDPCVGAFRGQRSFGVWHASDGLNAPVNWRLFLPSTWLSDVDRKRESDVPQDAREETLEECATSAVLDVLGSWDVPARPVVLNTHVSHVARTMDRFSRAGVPVIARVADTARFTVRDPALPGHQGVLLPAHQILTAARARRRRVAWNHRTAVDDDVRESLATTVAVQPVGTGSVMALLGEWGDPQSPAPQSLWVTNLVSLPVSTLLQATKLGGSACRDLAAAGEDVGLKDFEGRSFSGWHRHMTLASAAHAVATLTAASRPSWR